MPATDNTLTIVDAALYDTEAVDPTLRGVDFFANTRQFTAPNAGPKAYKTHTNLVGLGAVLPAGYSFLAKSMLIEIERVAAEDEKKVLESIIDLYVGDKAVERVKIEHGVKEPSGMSLSMPRKLDYPTHFHVSWPKLPEGLTTPFSMKVSLLGVMGIPGSGDEDEAIKARVKETYGRKPKPREPLALIWIHQRCAVSGEKLWHPPMTRRAYEKAKLRRLDARGAAVDATSRNTRRAWWCDRCGDRVKQDDMVAPVEVKG